MLINSPPTKPVMESQQELMGLGGSIEPEEDTYDAVRVQYDQIKRHVIALEVRSFTIFFLFL